MRINFSQRTDYSALFSSLPSQKNNSSGIGFSLSDYSTIKNGSYLKLMKAYYGKNASSEVKSIAKKSVSADSTTVNSKLQGSADSLKKSANALLKTGKDSLFTEKEMTVKDENGVETKKTGYDMDAIASAVSDFAKSYNSMIDAAKDSANSNVSNTASSMIKQTNMMSKMLSKVGVTVGEDNKLSVDTDALKKADVGTLKSLFNGVGSYAYSMQSRSTTLEMYSKTDVGKANGIYSQAATYTPAYNTGNIYNSYF